MKKLLLSLSILFILTSNALAAFPTTAVLDSGTHANGGPPLGGNWTVFNADGMKYISNAFSVGTISTTEIEYWNAASFGPNMEVFVTMATESDANSANLWFKYDTATNSGYRLKIDCVLNQLSVVRNDLGVGTTIGAVISQTISDGDVIGASYINGVITVYYNGAALTTRSDSIYASNVGRLMMGAFDADTGVRMTNFGGGNLPNKNLINNANINNASIN